MSNLNQPKKLKAQSIEEQLRLIGEDINDFEPIQNKYPSTLYSKDKKKLVVIRSCGNKPERYKDRLLEKVIYLNPIKKISENSFGLCESLQEVVIPNSVTEIGARAFGFCKSLREIVIPDSVTEIGISAFGACESLQKIVLPASIKKINKNTFEGCYALQ